MKLEDLSASLALDFVLPELESNLIINIKAFLANAILRSTERSRIVRFGWDYRGRQPVQPEPSWLHALYARFPSSPDSTTLNEYLPGSRIDPHLDPPEFDEPILILSLGASCQFKFSRDQEAFSFTFPPRALLSLRGPSRWAWEHSVLPVAEQRWSLVFRWLKGTTKG